MHPRDALGSRAPRALWACLALGTLLRLIWPLDFEWKFDEKWMFRKALRVAEGLDPWPWVGMPSGVGTENPGASIWVFAALAHIADDPVAMTTLVALLNALVLWGLAFWVQRTWPAEDRAIGFGGVALFAVSPLPVLFSRKIWAQDLLPVLLLPWLWAHARREHTVAAFVWGFSGALLGQVHMSGFFVAAALVIATLIVDRTRAKWTAWFLGSALGALPLLPWLSFLWAARGTHGASERVWSLRFFWDAFKVAWGVNLKYSLNKNFGAFLRGPELAGVQTWLVAAAHIALALLALVCFVVLVRQRASLRVSPLLQLYGLTVLIGGLLLHLAGIRIFPHYVIVFTPLPHIAAAWLLMQRKHLVVVACALQLFISASFLWFIHDNGGAPRGDYGVSYRAQSETQRDPNTP
jgi:hypothetical protein